MRLTDFSKTKRGNIALFFDGEFLFSVTPSLFATLGLSVGDETDVRVLEELRTRAEYEKAKEKALNLLSYKEYTSKELENRLCLHVDREAAEQSVARMEELGMLNDDDYAERFARDLYTRKKFGIYRIRQEMRRKGLAEDKIEFAISLLPDDVMGQICAVLEKKYPNARDDETVRRRAYAAMQRLGYRADDIRRAMSVNEYDDYKEQT